MNWVVVGGFNPFENFSSNWIISPRVKLHPIAVGFRL